LQNVSCPPSPVPCYGLSRPSASPAPKLQAPWRGAGSGGRFHERGREARRANTRASHPVNAAGCCQTQSASSDGVRISRARKAETRDTRACIHDRRAQDGAQPGLSRNVQQQQQGVCWGKPRVEPWKPVQPSPAEVCRFCRGSSSRFCQWGAHPATPAHAAQFPSRRRIRLEAITRAPATGSAYLCRASMHMPLFLPNATRAHMHARTHERTHTHTHTHTCTCTYKYTPELEQGATMMDHGMRARDAGAHAGARLGRNSQPAVVATLRARQLSPHPARLSWLEAAECGDPFLRSHRPGLRQQRPAGHCCRRLHCLRCSSSLAAHRLRRRPAHAIRPTTHGCSAGDAHGIPAAGRGPAGPGAMVARGGRG